MNDRLATGRNRISEKDVSRLSNLGYSIPHIAEMNLSESDIILFHRLQAVGNKHEISS